MGHIPDAAIERHGDRAKKCRIRPVGSTDRTGSRPTLRGVPTHLFRPLVRRNRKRARRRGRIVAWFIPIELASSRPYPHWLSNCVLLCKICPIAVFQVRSPVSTRNCTRGNLATGAWCAAGRGTTIRTTRARPTVITTTLIIVTTISAVGWCVVPHLKSFPLFTGLWSFCGCGRSPDRATITPGTGGWPTIPICFQ